MICFRIIFQGKKILNFFFLGQSCIKIKTIKHFYKSKNKNPKNVKLISFYDYQIKK